MEDDEIFNTVYHHFIEKKLYEKYQEDKALSTFITYCIKYGLCDVLKKERRKHRNKEHSLETMFGDPLCDSGTSTNVDEENDFPGLADFNTPEHLLLGKELRALIFEHFGVTDALVLLDYEDIKITAESLGISYDAYRKKLLRKKYAFKTFLENRGYNWN
jgi:hypothetical protein